ncbi:MAG TPA: hypothetical protein VK938_08295 [Methylophilaceae bacterium]|jgi:hypothetical protein|nr:hypothetical protein [Methylophilaceae bacterium]
MASVEDMLLRYDSAIELWADSCASNPDIWHRPDTNEFISLLPEILNFAKNGNIKCMYAAAMIYSFGLCYDSEHAYLENYSELISLATNWWGEAAAAGYLPAVDNLLTSGVGPLAEKARLMAKQIRIEHKDLIGSSNNMPVYGESFMQELHKRLYA